MRCQEPTAAISLEELDREGPSYTVDTLREICLALPGVTEDIKWGADLAFSVGGKMFCVLNTEGGFADGSKRRKQTPLEHSRATPQRTSRRARLKQLSNAHRSAIP